MKKARLLHSEISHVIAQMGHCDTLCIADSGLPIPESIRRIELALEAGIPTFKQTLAAVLSELQIEAAIIANETQEVSLQWKELQGKSVQFSDWLVENIPAPVTQVTHDDFKKQLLKCRAIIRTGEQTPYANVILQSGVTF